MRRLTIKVTEVVRGDTLHYANMTNKSIVQSIDMVKGINQGRDVMVFTLTNGTMLWATPEEQVIVSLP